MQLHRYHERAGRAHGLGASPLAWPGVHRRAPGRLASARAHTRHAQGEGVKERGGDAQEG